MSFYHLFKILSSTFAPNENVLKLKNLKIFYEYRVSEKVVMYEIFSWCEKWVYVNEKPLDILDARDAKFNSNINFLSKMLGESTVA